MYLPYPVARSDRHVALREIWYLFIYVSSSPCTTLLIEYSIICESLWHWGFRFGAFSSIAMFSRRGISMCWLSMI